MWKWLVEDPTKVVAAGVSIATAIFAVYQYAINIRWNRKKYAADEVRKIFSTPEVLFILRLLDWPDREFVLHGDAKDTIGSDKLRVEKDRLLRVLTRAILPYDPVDTFIRDCFDEFIRNIEWLCSFIDNGIMRWDDFMPYFGYWCEILTYKRHLDKEVIDHFWVYTDEFHNGKLVRKFVYEVEKIYQRRKRPDIKYYW